QTSYRFMYKRGVLDKAHPVSIEVTDRPLEEVLKLAFKDQNLLYELYDGTVTIREKPQAIDQQQRVSGRVLDENGQPLSGVSVRVLGKNRTTVTNNTGNYELQADIGDELQFTFIGYKQQTTKI